MWHQALRASKDLLSLFGSGEGVIWESQNWDQLGGPCGLPRRRCLPSNNARSESRRAFSARHFPCCLREGLCLSGVVPEGGAVRDGNARLAAVPHSPERFCGTAGLAEEKRHRFWTPKSLFFYPPPRKDKLLKAKSVTTSESLV